MFNKFVFNKYIYDKQSTIPNYVYNSKTCLEQGCPNQLCDIYLQLDMFNRLYETIFPVAFGHNYLIRCIYDTSGKYNIENLLKQNYDHYYLGKIQKSNIPIYKKFAYELEHICNMLIYCKIRYEYILNYLREDQNYKYNYLIKILEHNNNQIDTICQKLHHIKRTYLIDINNQIKKYNNEQFNIFKSSIKYYMEQIKSDILNPSNNLKCEIWLCITNQKKPVTTILYNRFYNFMTILFIGSIYLIPFIPIYILILYDYNTNLFVTNILKYINIKTIFNIGITIGSFLILSHILWDKPIYKILRNIALKMIRYI